MMGSRTFSAVCLLMDDNRFWWFFQLFRHSFIEVEGWIIPRWVGSAKLLVQIRELYSITRIDSAYSIISLPSDIFVDSDFWMAFIFILIILSNFMVQKKCYTISFIIKITQYLFIYLVFCVCLDTYTCVNKVLKFFRTWSYYYIIKILFFVLTSK